MAENQDGFRRWLSATAHAPISDSVHRSKRTDRPAALLAAFNVKPLAPHIPMPSPILQVGQSARGGTRPREFMQPPNPWSYGTCAVTRALSGLLIGNKGAHSLTSQMERPVLSTMRRTWRPFRFERVGHPTSHHTRSLGAEDWYATM